MRTDSLFSASSNQSRQVGHLRTLTLTLPILREEVQVQIRKNVTGVVRLEKTVREHQELVSQDLMSETISVEHIPVNRYIDKPATIRQEGEVTIIPVMEEIVIATKQLILKEEIRIVRHRTYSQYQEAVPLRTEEVQVSRLSPDPTTEDFLPSE